MTLNSHEAEGFRAKFDIHTISVNEYEILDYYARLNIAPNANPEDVKKSYRKLAMLLHPDREHITMNRSIEELTKLFQLLNEAYGIISDPIKRANYVPRKTQQREKPQPQRSGSEKTTSSGPKSKAEGTRSSFKFSEDDAKAERAYREYEEELAAMNRANQARKDRFKKIEKIFDAIEVDFKKNGKRKTFKEYYKEYGIDEKVLEISDLKEILTKEGFEKAMSELQYVNFFEYEDAVKFFFLEAYIQDQPEYADLYMETLDKEGTKKVISYYLYTKAIANKLSTMELLRHASGISGLNATNIQCSMLGIFVLGHDLEKAHILLNSIPIGYFKDKVTEHALRISAYTGDVSFFQEVLETQTKNIIGIARIIRELIPHLYLSVDRERFDNLIVTIKKNLSGYEIRNLDECVGIIGKYEKGEQSGMISLENQNTLSALQFLKGTELSSQEEMYLMIGDKELLVAIRAYHNGDKNTLIQSIQNLQKIGKKEIVEFLEIALVRINLRKKPRSQDSEQDISERSYFQELRGIVPYAGTMNDQQLTDCLQYQYNLQSHPELLTRRQKLDYINKMIAIRETIK